MKNRLFAIGDIHGCYDKLRTLIEQEIQLKKTDKTVLLGDYIDRGFKSKEVIDYIIDLQNKGFDIVSLTGNHEAMMMNALHNDINLPLWIQNGGEVTMKSFEISSIKNLDLKYITFFKGLQHYYAFEEFLFVHAGFNDDIENPFDDQHAMLWSYRENYKHPLFQNKTIIHGHATIKASTCEESLQFNKKVINIDTGCVYTNITGYGKLTAIELYSMGLCSI